MKNIRNPFSFSVIVIFIVSFLITENSYAEYYMVYPAPLVTVPTAFAECERPKQIKVLRVDKKHRHRYHAKKHFYSISTYRMTSCQTWGYMWVPGYYNECGNRVPGHWEERYGFYYDPVMSSTTHSEIYYDEGGDRWPVYDRATADDLSADIGDDP